MGNSSYSDILEEFGVPKKNLYQTLSVISPQLKFPHLKHQWDLIDIGGVNRERFI